MNEEMESTILDTSGNDPAPVVDFAPVDTSPSVEDAPAPEPDTAPETDDGSPSMEVISVDDLLGRLTAGEEASGEETSEAPEGETGEEAGESAGDGTEIPEETGPSAADTALELLETIQKDVSPHPFLTTDFADYTVTEGLLLLALLLSVISLCIKMLKEGFSWL